MPEESATSGRVQTVDVLRKLGFVAAPDPRTALPGELRKPLGSHTLTALPCIGRRFAPVVLVSGVIGDRRSITEVDFELPQEVESVELGMAWVAWHLDQQLGPGHSSLLEEPWLDLGRASIGELPWVREMAAYRARPMCRIPKDLAKPAFRRLQEHLAEVAEGAHARLRFDGEAFSIRVAEHLTIVPADGTAWELEYNVPAVSLRELPKRLPNRRVVVCIWDGALRIENRAYPGVEPLR